MDDFRLSPFLFLDPSNQSKSVPTLKIVLVSADLTQFWPVHEYLELTVPICEWTFESTISTSKWIGFRLNPYTYYSLCPPKPNPELLSPLHSMPGRGSPTPSHVPAMDKLREESGRISCTSDEAFRRGIQLYLRTSFSKPITLWTTAKVVLPVNTFININQSIFPPQFSPRLVSGPREFNAATNSLPVKGKDVISSLTPSPYKFPCFSSNLLTDTLHSTISIPT